MTSAIHTIGICGAAGTMDAGTAIVAAGTSAYAPARRAVVAKMREKVL
jgi:hypothetical protein